jgi:hypothetical protein
MVFVFGWFPSVHAFASNTNLGDTPSQPGMVISQSNGWITSLSYRARQVYARSLLAGHDARMFTLAGDSNSNPLRFLDRITTGAFVTTTLPELQATVAWFTPSYSHVDLAVGGGFRAADMFDTSKVTSADGCVQGEGMFACELRKSNASIVFIQLGTGDKFVWRQFEANYRTMIDYALSQNVLPVLVTKADDIESQQGGASYGFINSVIRRLAWEYQMPLVDLWAATRDMPVILNPALPTRPFTKYGLQDEWGYYFHLTDAGQDRHLMLTLQMLALIRNR